MNLRTLIAILYFFLKNTSQGSENNIKKDLFQNLPTNAASSFESHNLSDIQNTSNVASIDIQSTFTRRTSDSNIILSSSNGVTEAILFNQKDNHISSHLYSRGKIDECWKNAKCELLEENYCLGVKLPYTHTSLSLSTLTSQRASREALDQLSALKNLPHCWSVVQPFLCAVLFPECHNSSVQLPSKEMCTITRGPCKLMEQERGWPEFLKCKEEYPPKCKTSSRDLPFNTTGQCSPPLVNTSNEKHWYEGVKGCGVQCLDPLFTIEEHKHLQSFIAGLGGLCLACSAFTVLTYLIDWRFASKYPALIIFYINVCFLVASIGFMVQFHSDVKDRVTCHSDGTLRNYESSSEGYMPCVLVFICVYYFMIAAGMWFIIFGYAWHMKCKSRAAGQCQQNLKRKAFYFHLISWSIPLIFTMGIIVSHELKADSAAGICFMSPSIPVRIGALLLPFTCVIFGGGFFLIRGLKTLIQMKLECSNIISDRDNKKVVENIIRVIFTLALLIFLVITIGCHIYTFRNQDDWNESLRKYILCTSSMSHDSSNCSVAVRPSIDLYWWHLSALFGSGIIMASWCWTKNSIEAWQRFLRRVLDVDSKEPVRLSKHKVIAQAFAKRGNLNTAGRLSISLRSLHSDPLGLNFELNSTTSGDVSSVWAAAIPYLMNRRGAVSGSSAFLHRRNSIDSEYSIGMRTSLESNLNLPKRSRRHSLDSQMSFHVSDVERLAALHTAARFGGKRRRRDWFSLRKGKKGLNFDRRNSNTSDDSNMGSMILPAVTLSTNDSLFTTMMKRLNLSGEMPSSSVQRNGGVFHAVTDSEDENTGHIYPPHGAIMSSMLQSAEFSRTFNGFKKKGKSNMQESDFVKFEREKTLQNGGTSKKVAKASVGIQTSLESLNETARGVTEDKSCQVSTPLLRKSVMLQNSSTPSGSTTSLSESSKMNGDIYPCQLEETSFISDKNNRNASDNLLRTSRTPLSRSLKKASQITKNKFHKQSSPSENDKKQCVFDFQELSS